MTNMSPLTRKDQILRYLTENSDEWVDGTELSNEKVGGSEGLRRLRDLRSEGHIIQQRKHPNPDRDVWQYRLVTKPPEVSPLREQDRHEGKTRLVFGVHQLCSLCEGSGTKRGSLCSLCEGRGWK